MVVELGVQHVREFVHRGGVVFAEDLGDGDDGASGEAAGDDEVEVVHVRVEVDGEPVEGDPSSDADADGANLGGLVGSEVVLGVDPDAGGVGVGVGGDVELGECVDDGGLEGADVLVDAELGGVEVDDGVADELARAVVGDVAAAVGLVELHALGREEVLGGEDVGWGVGASGDGDDGVVLDHEDAPELGVGSAACVEDLLVVVLLELVCRLVGEELERDVGEGAHGEG